ncbi:hypothetical protein KIPB_005825, partial [Kipferlia bialata]|eukprot:g5825.t1
MASFRCTSCWCDGVSDRAALSALYTSTHGDTWGANNWDVSDPTSHHCSWSGVTCLPGTDSVVGLDLSGMGLRGEIPGEIGCLQFLKSLTLSDNALSSPLPDSFCDLVSLKYFTVVGAGLTGPLPPCLCTMEHIQYIHAGHNSNSGEIPSCMADMTYLREFSVPHNDLSGSVPQSVGDMPFMQGLSVQCNPGLVCTPMDTDMGYRCGMEYSECDYIPGDNLDDDILDDDILDDDILDDDILDDDILDDDILDDDILDDDILDDDDDLPPPDDEEDPLLSFYVETDDGVLLHYQRHDASPDPRPVLLIITPYNADTFTGDRLDPFYLKIFPAVTDMHIVAMDIRGMHNSGGVFDLWAQAPTDVASVIEHIMAQPWSRLGVMTAGCSADAQSQYLSLAVDPEVTGGMEHILGQLACVGTGDLGGWMTQGDSLRYNAAREWLEHVDQRDLLEDVMGAYRGGVIDQMPELDIKMAREGCAAIKWPSVHTCGLYDMFEYASIEAFECYRGK